MLDSKTSCLLRGIMGVIFGFLALLIPEEVTLGFYGLFWILIGLAMALFLFLAITARGDESMLWFGLSAALLVIGVISFYGCGICGSHAYPDDCCHCHYQRLYRYHPCSRAPENKIYPDPRDDHHRHPCARRCCSITSPVSRRTFSFPLSGHLHWYSASSPSSWDSIQRTNPQVRPEPAC